MGVRSSRSPKARENSRKMTKLAFYSNPEGGCLRKLGSGVGGSKTRTLNQKVGFEASKTCTLRQKVRQKRVPSARKWGPKPLPSRQVAFRDTPLWVRIKREFCHFKRVFSCIWRRAGSDPQAERGRGEVNLPPKEILTLRPRVGGLWPGHRQPSVGFRR